MARTCRRSPGVRRGTLGPPTRSHALRKLTWRTAGAAIVQPPLCSSVVRSNYEQPLVAPQLGQAWQQPARCMMSPQTWQSTVSDCAHHVRARR